MTSESVTSSARSARPSTVTGTGGLPRLSGTSVLIATREIPGSSRTRLRTSRTKGVRYLCEHVLLRVIGHGEPDMRHHRVLRMESRIGFDQLPKTAHQLSESVLLAIAAGLVGVAAAPWSLRLLLYLVPTNVPRLGEVTIDPRVLIFSLGVSVLTGALFGLAEDVRSPDADARLRQPGTGSMAGFHGLVDLVRFELTTSSMPFKKYQSLADSLAQNKRLSKRRRGLRWTPGNAVFTIWPLRGLPGLRDSTSETARRMLSRARLRAVVIVACLSRQQ